MVLTKQEDPFQFCQKGSIESKWHISEIDFQKKWPGPAAHPERFKQLQQHLNLGGLPGICFNRDPSIRAGKWASHVDALLRRDLRLVTESTLPASVIQALLSELALNQGQPLGIASLSRTVRISVKSIPHLIEAFESLFLIRIVECRGGVKKPYLFFEDSGLAHYFARGKASRCHSCCPTGIFTFFSTIPLPGRTHEPSILFSNPRRSRSASCF